VHSAGIAQKPATATTHGGNSMVTMFDLKTLAVIKQIKVDGASRRHHRQPDD
jgi:hypothetical protein